MPRGLPKKLVLNSVSVHFDPESGRIQLRAFMRDGLGRRGFEARPAKNEVLGAVASYLMHDSPKGATVRVKDLVKNEWYELSCRATQRAKRHG